MLIKNDLKLLVDVLRNLVKMNNGKQHAWIL